MKTFLTSLVSLSLIAGLGWLPVQAGPLAPATRVITDRDRDFLEWSGAQTLEELLDTGIVRYFFTGGQSLPVLVNGRPYSTTDGDLDTLPLSAIERVELLGGDSLGTLGGGAVRGAINIVLRKDLDGFETRVLTRLPSRDGGDGTQGSAFWGGDVGQGHMTIGVDVLRRQEIPARSREFSRSSWPEGGAFNEAQNVSIGGNTVWVVQRDEDDEITGARSVALGDCDPAKGYTGPLRNPPGIRNDDVGCGYAYGNIMWNTDRLDQRTAILNLDHPLGEGAEFHIDANFGQGESAFRYAPPVDVFSFTPTPEVMSAINEAAGSTIADANDRFAVGHRFVGHGNRDWRSEFDEYDISAGVEGQLAEGLGYDARMDVSRLDGSLAGDTFVHVGRIREEIAAGHYDLADPFSTAPEHLQAIRNSSLHQEVDFGVDYLGARLALEGNALPIGGRDAAWTAGVDAGRTQAHSLLRFRDNGGMTHDVTQVLGAGGVSFTGERETVGAFAEVQFPLIESMDVRVAGRGDEYDDVGGLGAWSLGTEYRLSDSVALRSSWSTGQRPPSMKDLHSTEDQDHPYIECDPGNPPQPCAQPNPRQVTRYTLGNPELDPSDTKRFAIGAEFRESARYLSVEWYRLSRTGLVGQNTADWAMENFSECADGDTVNCIERTGGDITIYDSYANILEDGISGITTRFGRGFETAWGDARISGAWRHVTDTDLRIAGNREQYPISRNMARVRFAARRGNVHAIWTVNYRAGFNNLRGTGEFESWTGHDVALDWKKPLGMEGARVAIGVFNLTDASLTVDTSNPSSTDGPTAAGWGRTFFLAFNMRF